MKPRGTRFRSPWIGADEVQPGEDDAVGMFSIEHLERQFEVPAGAVPVQSSFLFFRCRGNGGRGDRVEARRWFD